MTEIEDAIEQSAERLIARARPVPGVRALRERQQSGHDASFWQAFAAAGLAGVLIDPMHGGSGLGLREAARLASVLERRLVPTPFLGSSVCAALALQWSGGPLATACLPRLADGSECHALAVDEGAKHAPWAPRTVVARHGDGFHLRGCKVALEGGGRSHRFLVTATTEDVPGGMALFLVPRDLDGLAITPRPLLDGQVSERLNLDVRLPASTLVGAYGAGRSLLERILAAAAVVAAAGLVTIARECLERTVEYLKVRRQFGRRLGEYQALQHRAARLHAECEASRALVGAALGRMDGGDEDAPRWVAASKLRAGDTAALALAESIQMHGGVGMTEDLDFGYYLRRTQCLREFVGDADFQGNELERLAMGAAA